VILFEAAMYSPSASADYLNALGVQAEALEVWCKANSEAEHGDDKYSRQTLIEAIAKAIMRTGPR
jgi:hypothetical protein